MSHNTHEQFPTPRSSGQRSGASGEAHKSWATAAALLTLALGQVAKAADGQLDPSFGGDGLVILDVGSERNEFQAVAVQPDGKIVAAGDVGIVTSRNFAVARFNPDGSLDPGFGTGGINRTTDVSGANLRDFAEGLALQADGKIVLAGQSGPDGAELFAVARYNPDGSLDDGGSSDSTPGEEFGVNGTMLTPFAGGRSIARAVTVQPDGKIVVTGQLVTGTGAPEENPGDFALARYNSDGSLDTSFGGDGLVTTNVFPDESAQGVAMQPDGKIVVTGFGAAISVEFDDPLNDFVLLRYNLDGSLDRSFDGDGIVTTDFGDRDDQAASSSNRTASWSQQGSRGAKKPMSLRSRATTPMEASMWVSARTGTGSRPRISPTAPAAASSTWSCSPVESS